MWEQPLQWFFQIMLRHKNINDQFFKAHRKTDYKDAHVTNKTLNRTHENSFAYRGRSCDKRKYS